MTILDLKIVKNADAEGYDIADIKQALTPEQYSKFNNWFAGQTGGITDDGKFFVYTWDWQRFLQDELGLSIG